MYLCRPSEASIRYCVIPGGFPPQDWQSFLCAGEELDLNPGLLICSQVRYHWATSPPSTGHNVFYHLALNISISVRTAQFIGEFLHNKGSTRDGLSCFVYFFVLHVVPILLVLQNILCLQRQKNGKFLKIRKFGKYFVTGMVSIYCFTPWAKDAMLRKLFLRRISCCATVHPALVGKVQWHCLTLAKPSYFNCSTDRKWKYVKYRIVAYLYSEQPSSTTALYQ